MSMKLVIFIVTFIIKLIRPSHVCLALNGWTNNNKNVNKKSRFGITSNIDEKNSYATKKKYFFQPWMRWKVGDYEGLKKDCLQYYYSSSSSSPSLGKKSDINDFKYEESTLEGFQVANSIFQHIFSSSSACSDRNDMKGSVKWIWLPALTRQGLQETEKLIQMMNNDVTSSLLGIHNNVTLLNWPDVPAPCIQWSYSEIIPTDNCVQNSNTTTSSDNEEDDLSTLFHTEKWVNNTLGRLRLCPFTASMSRGAIGLESVGVAEGPVAILNVPIPSRVSTSKKDEMILAARGTMAKFWKGVDDIATIPESQLSTYLIVCKEYDDQFDLFVKLCDHLIEPSVKAVNGNNIIGKAWFHPLYNTASVYNHDNSDNQSYSPTTILPGHALQVPLIQSFLKQHYPTYYDQNGKVGDNQNGLSYDNVTPADIALANDEVRHTPHATVNILRRSQLNAAKEMEKSTKNSRPNFIYARNIMKILTEKL